MDACQDEYGYYIIKNALVYIKLTLVLLNLDISRF